MIGDMWNFVNLGKRVDGCEDTLEKVYNRVDSLMLISLRSGIFKWKRFSASSVQR